MESDEDDPPYGFQTCPICMDDDDGTIWMTACCNNTIHEHCYNMCVHRYHSCPFCRTPAEVDPDSHIIDIGPIRRIVLPRDDDFTLTKYAIGMAVLGFLSVCGTVIFHMATT